MTKPTLSVASIRATLTRLDASQFPIPGEVVTANGETRTVTAVIAGVVHFTRTETRKRSVTLAGWDEWRGSQARVEELRNAATRRDLEATRKPKYAGIKNILGVPPSPH